MTRILCAILILFGLSGSNLPAEDLEELDADRLAKLKNSWNQANETAARPITGRYLDSLIKLRNHLTKKEKLVKARVVQEEIDTLTSKGSIDDRQEAEGANFGELVTLRVQYQRAMKDVLKSNEKKYIIGLKALKKFYSKMGDLQRTLEIDEILKSISEGSGEAESEWATIRIVESELKFAIDELKPGVARLSGAYGAKFNQVSDELIESQFARVPYSVTSKMKIEVVQSGKLIIISILSIKPTGSEANWKKASKLVKGPYMPFVYVADVKKGQEFICEALEIAPIAAKILTK